MTPAYLFASLYDTIFSYSLNFLFNSIGKVKIRYGEHISNTKSNCDVDSKSSSDGSNSNRVSDSSIDSNMDQSSFKEYSVLDDPALASLCVQLQSLCFAPSAQFRATVDIIFEVLSDEKRHSSADLDIIVYVFDGNFISSLDIALNLIHNFFNLLLKFVL